MKKSDLVNKANGLLDLINSKYPKKVSTGNSPISRIVELNGVKYEIEYRYDTEKIHSIYKVCAKYGIIPWYLYEKTVKELTNVISMFEQILRATEIEDGPVLQPVTPYFRHDIQQMVSTLDFWSATMRVEANNDFFKIAGLFADLNEEFNDECDGDVIYIDEYKAKDAMRPMDSDYCKLSIHKNFTVNDVKAMIIGADLGDVDIAIQTLDYAQFDGLRDKCSHYPSDELVEKWRERLYETA